MYSKIAHIASDPIVCGRRFYFILYVYDTVLELQMAAKKYTPHDTDFNDCWGCFQPSLSWVQSEDGKHRRPGYRTPFLGVMRLTTEDCNDRIVVHESTHAAINYVSAVNLTDGYKVGSSRNNDRDEQLCYAVQEFSWAVRKIMGLS